MGVICTDYYHNPCRLWVLQCIVGRINVYNLQIIKIICRLLVLHCLMGRINVNNLWIMPIIHRLYESDHNLQIHEVFSLASSIGLSNERPKGVALHEGLAGFCSDFCLVQFTSDNKVEAVISSVLYINWDFMNKELGYVFQKFRS